DVYRIALSELLPAAFGPASLTCATQRDILPDCQLPRIAYLSQPREDSAMKKLVFAAVAAAFLAAPALAADSPAAGAWAIEAKSDFGTFKSDWAVAEADGAWTIDMQDQPMEGGM